MPPTTPQPTQSTQKPKPRFPIRKVVIGIIFLAGIVVFFYPKSMDEQGIQKHALLFRGCECLGIVRTTPPRLFYPSGHNICYGVTYSCKEFFGDEVGVNVNAAKNL